MRFPFSSVMVAHSRSGLVGAVWWWDDLRTALWYPGLGDMSATMTPGACPEPSLSKVDRDSVPDPSRARRHRPRRNEACLKEGTVGIIVALAEASHAVYRALVALSYTEVTQR